MTMSENVATKVRRRRIAAALSVVLAVASVLLFSHAAYIWTKARAAQVLLHVAWQRTLMGAHAARPWPWADTFAVGRLQVPRLGADDIVLAGASGRTMAFGPAHVDGSALPGEFDNCVLTAHRDTHFAFLRQVRRGDEIRLQDGRGRWSTYEVMNTAVIDEHETRLMKRSSDARLTLVTCYPFFAVVPGGPLRYVVIAKLRTSTIGSRDSGPESRCSRPAGGVARRSCVVRSREQRRRLIARERFSCRRRTSVRAKINR